MKKIGLLSVCVLLVFIVAVAASAVEEKSSLRQQIEKNRDASIAKKASLLKEKSYVRSDVAKAQLESNTALAAKRAQSREAVKGLKQEQKQQKTELKATLKETRRQLKTELKIGKSTMKEARDDNRAAKMTARTDVRKVYQEHQKALPAARKASGRGTSVA